MVTICYLRTDALFFHHPHGPPYIYEATVEYTPRGLFKKAKIDIFFRRFAQKTDFA